MISTRSAGLVIDTVVCLTLAKWETVSGQFGGYLRPRLCRRSRCQQLLVSRMLATSMTQVVPLATLVRWGILLKVAAYKAMQAARMETLAARNAGYGARAVFFHQAPPLSRLDLLANGLTVY